MRGTTIACLLPLAAFAVGCGGGERQDANEPSGSFALEVAQAEFPAKQSLAEPTELRIQVKNTDSKALPNVAVTVNSFAKKSTQPGLADPSRPVWIVDAGPEGGETAFVNTWALGKVEPGQSKTFTWKVTAIQAGMQKLSYKVSPGLDGKATPADGSKAGGSFTVNISREPAQASVDPETGEVIRGDS
ncbi:hypothetical protein DSM112329_01500 [Paraconexibacter sp. AEG42_29]|uniref:Intracellular proteinase inhibitor BsuPI domain-containing protein n=1 Tax=Paraconexibacter sp. AEG42_29 TaxID=2997339 RepID=A0AAU7ASJ7_9ACTN